MSLEIPIIEPAELIVGDTWTWQRTLPDYPAGTWTLTYYLRSQEGELNIVCTASGTDHLVSVAKATTAGYKAGFYSWIATVTDGTTRTTLERGIVTIKPDPSKVGAGLDPRSHARKVLDAIEAILEGRATKDQEEYTIGTRSLKRTPIADLINLRAQYRSEVTTEEAKARLAAGQPGMPRLLARL